EALAAKLGPDWTVTDRSVGSQTYADMEDGTDLAGKESDPASEDIDPLITGGTDLLIAWAGPNDVATGGDNLNAAAAYERVKTYVGNRQAAGWRVYVCTSPHTGAATQ
ncbi:hypothetical protein R0K05_18810, partial [Planococcus sp. SIMBA_160]